MRLSVLALVGAAAVASASWEGPWKLPPGIDLPGDKDKDFGPWGPPDKDSLPIWHPPHKGIIIDDCDDDHDDKWHWVRPEKPDKKHDKPPGPPHKWTTSTITATSTKTVIDCGDDKPCGGGHKPTTKYTTVTVPVTTTICPVPDVPKTTPTKSATPPPPPPPPTKTPTPPPPPPPPATSTSVKAPPPPPPTSKPAPPPVTTPSPIIIIPSSVGTVTRPAPSATTSRAVVTAGAVPKAQAAGGALAIAAAVAAALF